MIGETITALATVHGISGVAVVRVSGPDAFTIVEKVTGAKLKPRQVQFVDFELDESVVISFKGPKSYTGEDVVEIQCHGGLIVPERIIAALIKAGARMAKRGEFTERAYLNGRLDYDQAKAVLALIESKTERAAKNARERLKGRKSAAVKSLYETALTLSSELEHALDVDEGDLPEGWLKDKRERLSALGETLDNELKHLHESRLLEEGALVVIAGEPNAGKSSIMNALLEENRVIVSEVAGTTRDSVEAWINLEGWPIRLVDTAGLRDTEDRIELEGVKRARELMAKADLVIGVDCSEGVRIHNKCDLSREVGVLNVSAKTREGIEELKRLIVQELVAKVGDAEDEGLTGESLIAARRELVDADDPVLLANGVRKAAEILGEALGKVYTADLLDQLFSRFCVGK